MNVRRDPYVHQRVLLDNLIADFRDQFHTEQRALVVVENAAGACIISGEQSIGWIRSRVTEELDEV
ncbi:MAG: hypothetical protein P1P77_16810 [Spirochaetaceae bacterium]|nr:hypothetical protein [Spirochaetaceae bacterium]